MQNSQAEDNGGGSKVESCVDHATDIQEPSAPTVTGTTEITAGENSTPRMIGPGGLAFRRGECSDDTDRIDMQPRSSIANSKGVLCQPLSGEHSKPPDTRLKKAAKNSNSREIAEISRDIRTSHANDDNLARNDVPKASPTGDVRPPSRLSESLSVAIPRKKRPRLEESLGDENDESYINHSEEKDAYANVSLNQLKRQVLGRDLKVDGGENDWEDENDAEIRQIKALMNATNAADDDHDCPEATLTKDSNEGFPENKGLASTNRIPSTSSSLPEKLRKDLMCAICHEVVYPPVALQCGHTFCQPCINWWFDHDTAGRCPTCRRQFFPGSDKYSGPQTIRTSPNLALRACVMAMFGPEIVVRLQNRKKLRPKGERGGAHSAGYQVLSELRDETWHYVAIRTDRGNVSNPSNTASTVQVRRNIVLDAEDQRMQLALAVYHKPIKEVRSERNLSRGYGECFRVELCMLTMEEDEAVDSGFPTNIVSPDDEFLVCGGHHGSSRFLYSCVEVQMKDETGRLSPLARVSADPNNGRFKYAFDPSESAGNAGTETIRSLLFQHSETGSQLEIDLAKLQDRAGGGSLLPPHRSRPQNNKIERNNYGSDEEYNDDPRNVVMGQHDDSEEDEDQDEFEEDDFLVGDSESPAEGAFSDGEEEEDVDEHDRCVICRDGGELMICDGGDKNPGCGKSFHAECVSRSAIPNGDWICQACAKAGGIETGIEGHEFREPDQASDTVREERAAERDASADADDDNSVMKGAFSDAPGDESSDDDSVAQGAFSDVEQNDVDAKKTSNVDDEEDSVSQEQPEASVVKPSTKRGNHGTKRRFVLEDSDSD